MYLGVAGVLAGGDCEAEQVVVRESLPARVEVAVEAFGQRREDAWLGTGLRWTFSERFSAHVSFALQARGDKARQVSVGVRLNF